MDGRASSTQNLIKIKKQKLNSDGLDLGLMYSHSFLQNLCLTIIMFIKKVLIMISYTLLNNSKLVISCDRSVANCFMFG